MRIGTKRLWAGMVFLLSGSIVGATKNAPISVAADPGSWSLSIDASIAGLSDSLAAFGVRPDATPDYDAAYDVPHPPNPPGDYIEAYFPHTGGNWPTLLGTRFSTDITSAVSPRWILKVETTLSSGTVMLSWDTSMIAGFPPDYQIFMKDSATGDTISLRRESSYTFAYSGTRTFALWAEVEGTFVPVNQGWNLVSVPRVAPEFLKSALFPTALSSAFAYDGGYQVVDTLVNGKGYWLKFDSTDNFLITGSAVASMSVPVKVGWNIIGGLDHAITAPSGGIIVSSVFGYSGGYGAVTQMEPGKGYWVKTDSAGNIALGSSTPKVASEPANTPRSLDLVVTDARGSHARLRLIDEVPGFTPDRFDLPPCPPVGAFDVRFESGRWTEFFPPDPARESSYRISIQANAFPLKITCKKSDPSMRMYLGASSGNREVNNVRQVSENEWRVDGPLAGALTITLAEGGSPPKAFSLGRAYPNPFNPSSTIGYSLPELSMVRITLIDLLGREIAILSEGCEFPGEHRTSVSGGSLGLSSGVYFVRMNATGVSSRKSFDAVEKLLYAK